MALVTIPNVSEGRDGATVRSFEETLAGAGCRVLDVHSDAAHNRSVFTSTGSNTALVDGLGLLAERAAELIDLSRQSGLHPRVGALDVCPFVPHEETMQGAIAAAREAGLAIAQRSGLPVYLYGAASRERRRELPEIRRDGLPGLIRRAAAGFVPDFGPSEIDPRRGVVCVGARSVLIAFNVWLDASGEAAVRIAAEVRAGGGGLPGVRALGFEIDASTAQVSMNLTEPDRAGIEDAYAAVSERAARLGVSVSRTEIVGLVPERYLPNPDAEAARLLIEPGRSLESLLAA